MRPLKPGTIALVLLLTNLLNSCSTPKDLEYRDFRNFTIEKVGFASSAVKMDLVYYNPNNFGLQLKRTDLDIYIDSTYLGHTIQEYQITIPKQREFTLPITIDVDMKNLLKNALNTAFKKDVLVTIKGTVKVGKMNAFKSFAVNYSGNHTIDLF